MGVEAEQAEESKVKRVWILGAGFSRPLGGPLLDDLLTMRGYRKLQRVFPSAIGNTGDWLNEAQAFLHAVYLLYHWGRGFPEGHLFGVRVKEKGEQLFGHAEEFLVEVDKLPSWELMAYWRVAEGSHQNSTIGKVHEQLGHYLTNEEHETFARGFLDAANRLMAFECSAFHQELLEHSDRIRRKWTDAVCEPFLPYESWAEALGETDALIVFNYDNVAEFFTKDPHVRIVKMHGSVESRESFEQVGYRRLQGTEYSPNIGIPGTSKANKDFKTGWEEAARHLRSADQVVFMGYGLPESDAKARSFLLEGLRKNQTKHLRIEVVLGEPNFRTQRLEATLRQALAHRVHTDGERRRQASQLNAIADKLDTLKGQRGKHSDGNGTLTIGFSNGEQLTMSTDEDVELLIQEHQKRYDDIDERFKDMTLSVLPQYAQDYMQGFATSEGEG